MAIVLAVSVKADPPENQSSEESEEFGSNPPSLSGAVVTGAKWKLITLLFSEGSRVVVALVLARLLSPTDYGVAGMAIVTTSLVVLFTDPAFGTALVQKKSITERDRSTIFWASVVIGVTATVGGIAVSGFVARIFDTPQVQPLFAVTSLSFLFNALAITPTALMFRQLAYRSLQIREIAAQLIGAACALLVAVLGFGPWAIVANWLAFSVTAAVLVWALASWRPRFIFSRESLRDLGGFGMKVFGARTMTWANVNIDNVLVGRVLGATALGAYSLAYNVMFLPMARIGVPLQQVVSPAFARMQDDRARLEAAWLRSKRVSTALLIPSFFLVLAVAPDLVNVVFGSKWDAAIRPLQCLCIAGVAHSLVALHFSIVQACGEGGALLRLNTIVTIVTVGAFVVGVQFGIVGVAAAYAVAKWLLVLVDTRITTSAVSFDFWRALRAGTGTLPLGALAAAAAIGLRLLLTEEGVAPVIRLIVVSILMLALYVGLVWLSAPTLVAEVRNIVRRRRGVPETA